MPLPLLRTGLIDLEHDDPILEFGVTLRERVEAGAEQHILRDPLVDDEILDEPSASNDGRSIGTGADRVHVRPLTPAIFGCGHCETDLVVDEAWRIVELHVHRSPQRGTHSAAVRLHADEVRGDWAGRRAAEQLVEVRRGGRGAASWVVGCRAAARPLEGSANP